jgi:hypothetical protein
VDAWRGLLTSALDAGAQSGRPYDCDSLVLPHSGSIIMGDGESKWFSPAALR